VTGRIRPQRLLEAALALVALGFAVSMAWDLTRVRPLPPPPATPVRVAAPASTGPSGTSHRAPGAAAASTIAARNLFSASRSEATAVVAAAPAGPKPVLHGVLVDGDKSRAYLEDPVAKRVFGYMIGDTIGGGRLEQITDGGVVIRRADGPIEVIIQDPTKPKAATAQPSVPRPAVTPPPTTPAPTEKAPQ
jgi:hypothetical protein